MRAGEQRVRDADPHDHRDHRAELRHLVEQAGGMMRLYGVPISEEQLRSVVERHAKDRLLAAVAPPLANEPQIEEHW